MAEKKKLLLVNDDMTEDESTIGTFSHCGIDAVIVGSAKEALEEIKNTRFDLIVSDIVLNDGEEAGLELVRKIRTSNKEIKIFISTGYDDFYREKALAAGANGYFHKPYDWDRLFFEPLGLKIRLESKARKEKSLKRSQQSLRKSIHELGNKHNSAISASYFLKEALEEFIKEKTLPADTRIIIERAINDLGEIGQAGKEADELLKKIMEAVYEEVDPDRVKVKE